MITRAIEVVMDRKIYSLGWYLLKKLFEFKMVLREDVFLQSEDGFCFQYMILGDGYLIEDIWERYRDFYTKYNALEIMNFGMDFIMKIHFCCNSNKNKPPAMQVCSQTALASSKNLLCYNTWILGVNMTRLVPSLREPHIFLPAY